ncbi:MAG: sulfotransferase domain-containing protein [Candidatus Bathyarchaeota archaeon]|nr:MAG: sulfotransferase domain-containing protein [Candidatus Bathyarchaeota archaeon]
MPDFIIIGAQRCGTTSLYNYLIQHPWIAPASNKEVHFFDYNFGKGLAWYRAHFPSFLHKYYSRRVQGQDTITGESSPYYLFHPHVPNRILETAPQVKLIVILRNPVDRAYSHYHHERRLGFEALSFEEAIRREEERLEGELERMIRDEKYHSFNHQHYSYLSRGIYVDQIRAWMNLFPKNQILILKSEDFHNDPRTVYNETVKFFGLPAWQLGNFKEFNVGDYPKMPAAMRKHLSSYFNSHNKRLYEYLGRDFGWN